MRIVSPFLRPPEAQWYEVIIGEILRFAIEARLILEIAELCEGRSSFLT